MRKRAGPALCWAPRSPCLSLLFIGLLTSCAAQSAHLSHKEADTICFVPNHFSFGIIIPAPEPICLPADAPPPTPDEFLSFEEWKSLKLEENVIAHQDRATSPNPSDPSLHAPDVATDITSSPTTDGNLPLPSLRVPLTDRFNYASSECSARIQSSHKSVKSPWAVLNSKRDKYMLSPCGVREKFVVVELCDDIQVDTIQLANFEFFSGVFKDISISASSTYDADHWQFLGTFRAKNIRTVQSFLLPRDSRFFRHIRIEFLSHYGSEYYCPVSLMRVYGLTQIEEYKWDEWQAAWRREHEVDSREMLPLGSNDPFIVPASADTVHGAVVDSGNSAVSTGSTSPPSAGSSSTSSGWDTPHNGETTTPASSRSPAASPTLDIRETSVPPITDIIDPIIDDMMRHIPEHESSSSQAAFADTQHSASDATSCLSSTETSTNQASSSTSSSSPLDPHTVTPSDAATTTRIASQCTNQTFSTSSDSGSVAYHAVNVSSSPSSALRSAIVISTQTRPTGTNSAGGNTAGSESIYRNIMNRLTVLEANSSLGVRYVEDQARYVREALKRLEQDIGRLETLSNQQQLLYRRTVLELRQHKRDTEAERSALLSQLEALSDEVHLEKRLGLAQLCLLVVVLVFMAFTRSASLATSLRDTISNDVVAGAKPGSGLWQFKRAGSEPERMVLAPELAVRPSKSPKPTGSAGESFQRRMGLSTPIPRPSLSAGRHLVNVMSPRGLPLGTPFKPRDDRTVGVIQNSPRSKHLVGELPRRPQAVSHHNSPLQHPPGAPLRDESFLPGGARRALAKTAHLHEVSRRRRVSNSRGQQSSGTPETPASPPRTIDSNEENEVNRRDSCNAAQTPTGTPRHRSRAGSRGASRLHSPSASASFAPLSRSPPRYAQAIGREKHSEELSESASGSDLWEDTSDAGDADSEEASAEALFNPKTRDRSQVLRSAENLSRPSSGHLRRPPAEIDAERPTRWPPKSPDAATRNIYIPEPHRTHLSPVGLQS